MRGIAQTLVLTGAVPENVVADALSRYGETPEFEQYLVSNRFLTDQQFAQAVALQLNLKLVDLTSLNLEPSVIALVPAMLCRRYRVLPIARSGDQLTLAMVDPTNINALDDVGSVTGLLISPVVAGADAMGQALDRYIRSDDELSDLSAALEDAAAEHATATDEFEDADSDAPIVRFVNLLISQAIQDRASDIHVEPGEHELTVRYRIDGVLHETQKADRNIQDGVISRLKIMSEIDIAERRKPQDGRMSVIHDGRQVDLRVATLPTVWGEKVVMRILDNSGAKLRLSDLRMSEANLVRFKEAYTRPHGMILVTGPTGSGKSTTLYTTLSEVANPRVNVITVEDPVEQRLAGINQVQVNPKAGLTFDTALRSILRSDPDVVLVGEIRDHETAVISIEASLTGHMVLSTLHTNDAPSAITRLVEIGVEPFLVGTALTCVVAQRLARKLCDRCRQPYTESPDVLATLGFPLTTAGVPTLYKPVGCSVCSGTGYRGRIALHEVMPVTDEMEQQVVLRASGADLRALAVSQGMLPLREDGWQKVVQGLTTIEEVLRVAA